MRRRRPHRRGRRNGIRPEGIISGPGGTYYVGSLADGRLVTGNVRTGTQRTLLQGAVGRSLRGLFHDDRTGFVWAVVNVGDVAHVWAVNGHNGTVVSDTVVPGGVFLNDLVVTSNRVWVTDSSVDRVVAVPIGRRGYPTRGDLVVLPLRGSWPAGDGTSFNADGFRELPDHSLVLNNIRVGGLWQVNRYTGAARAIAVTGGPGIVSAAGSSWPARCSTTCTAPVGRPSPPFVCARRGVAGGQPGSPT